MIAVSSGAVPVIASVHAASKEETLAHAVHARESGAAAVIAMPPYVEHIAVSEISNYYQNIATVSQLPVFVQNFRPPMGTPMQPELLCGLLSIEGVSYIKEETDDSSQYMSRTMAIAGANLLGIFGGRAGLLLPDEYERGVSGSMPAMEFTNAHVRLWSALEAGSPDANLIYQALLPLLAFEIHYGSIVVCKEVLRMRGVMKSAATRSPDCVPLDDVARRRLGRLLADLNSVLEAPTQPQK
jgi:4-hydroxy-tetrahydrodipicolinate synthase